MCEYNDLKCGKKPNTIYINGEAEKDLYGQYINNVVYLLL